jgi:hypothetical protein
LSARYRTPFRPLPGQLIAQIQNRLDEIEVKGSGFGGVAVSASPGGALSGSGTLDHLARWTAATTLGDSIAVQDLTNGPLNSGLPCCWGLTLPTMNVAAGDLYNGYWINGQDEGSPPAPVYKTGGTYLDLNGWLSIHGKAGTGVAFPEGLLGTFNVKVSVSGIQIFGARVLELGAGVTKESNAGKIGYETFTADALDIVGAGTTGANRKIMLWSEGGLSTSAPTFRGTGATIAFGNSHGDVVTLQRDDGVRDYPYSPRGYQLDGQDQICGIPSKADITLFAYPTDYAGPSNPPRLYYRDLYGTVIGPLGGVAGTGTAGYVVVWGVDNTIGEVGHFTNDGKIFGVGQLAEFTANMTVAGDYEAITIRGRVFDWSVSDLWFGYGARGQSIIFGNGAATPLHIFSSTGAMSTRGDLMPMTDNQANCGLSSYRWKTCHALDFYGLFHAGPDLFCSDMRCPSCKKAFDPGDEITFVIREVLKGRKGLTDEISYVPKHSKCPAKMP